MNTKTKTIIEKEIEMPIPEPSDAIKVAVLTNDIKHFNDTLVRIESKFDVAIGSFVTVEKLADAQQRADEKHKEQDKAIKELQDWNTWFMRAVGVLLIAAVMGGVLITK